MTNREYVTLKKYAAMPSLALLQGISEPIVVVKAGAALNDEAANFVVKGEEVDQCVVVIRCGFG